MLLPVDEEYLSSKFAKHEVTAEGDFICLVIPGYRLPKGYEPQTSDLLVRLPQGYPDAIPDMFWFDPPVQLSSTKAPPPNADQTESHCGRSWQRFSRHFPQGAWKTGQDGLREYFSLIRSDLQKWVEQSA